MNLLLRYVEGLKLNTKLIFGLGFMLLIVMVIGVQSVYSERVQWDTEEDIQLKAAFMALTL